MSCYYEIRIFLLLNLFHTGRRNKGKIDDQLDWVTNFFYPNWGLLNICTRRIFYFAVLTFLNSVSSGYRHYQILLSSNFNVFN